jgi:hypothetical protein
MRTVDDDRLSKWHASFERFLAYMQSRNQKDFERNVKRTLQKHSEDNQRYIKKDMKRRLLLAALGSFFQLYGRSQASLGPLLATLGHFGRS